MFEYNTGTKEFSISCSSLDEKLESVVHFEEIFSQISSLSQNLLRGLEIFTRPTSKKRKSNNVENLVKELSKLEIDNKSMFNVEDCGQLEDCLHGIVIRKIIKCARQAVKNKIQIETEDKIFLLTLDVKIDGKKTKVAATLNDRGMNILFDTGKIFLTSLECEFNVRYFIEMMVLAQKMLNIEFIT